MLYRARPLVPAGTHELTVDGLHDRVQVFADGAPLGVLDRESGTLPLSGTGQRVALTLLELEHFGGRIELRDRSELGPPEEYVETFG